MKTTFRKFLEDIYVSPGVYSGADADETIDRVQHSVNTSERWKKLPVDFGHEGFTVLYRKDVGGEFEVALVDNRDLSGFKMPFGFALPKDPNRVAVNIALEGTSHTLLDNTGAVKDLHGVMTSVLSGNRVYRGSGLAPMLYKTLVDHGQVLFSSTSQSPGGQSTWRRLINSAWRDADVGVICPEDAAAKLLSRHAKENQHILDLYKIPNRDRTFRGIESHLGKERFLVTGPISALDKVAYSHDHTFWVIAPKGELDNFQKFAVKIQ